MLQVGFFYQYLMQFHHLPVGELGQIMINKKSAFLKVLDKKIDPPVYEVEFISNAADTNQFISWLADRLSVSIEDAEAALKKYIHYLKQILHKEGQLEWKHMGVWIINESAQIVFKVGDLAVPVNATLSAEKLIRENVAHEVLIGDRTYSGEQLAELLGKNKKKSLQNNISVAAAFIGAAIIIVIFSMILIPGFMQSHQRQIKLMPQPATETYTIINAD